MGLIHYDSIQKIDAITLAHLGRELNRMLTGARVSRINHPNIKEFLITFWGHAHENDSPDLIQIPRGELNQFYINLHPEFCYALLLGPGEKDQLLRTTLHHPTAVCMLLRKHLGNAKVINVWTLPDERVLNIRFENFNELGNKVSLVLSLELMGKHSNMMLYDELTQDILAISHSVSEHMSRYRELTVGMPYAPPPLDLKSGLRKPSLRQLTQSEFSSIIKSALPEDFTQYFTDQKSSEISKEIATEIIDTLATVISQQIAGMGKKLPQVILSEYLQNLNLSNNNLCPQIPSPLEGEGKGGGDHPDQPLNQIILTLYNLLFQLYPSDNNTNSIQPTISPDLQLFSLMPISGGTSFSLVHDMLRGYLLPKTTNRRLYDSQRQLSQVLESHEKKRQKREQTLTPIAETEIEQLQQLGHLLMAALSSGELPERATTGTIIIPNMYGSGEPIVLEIDPTLSWLENTEQYYRRAKKAKARQVQYDKQYETLTNERDFLAELHVMVKQADSLKMLEGIEEDLVTHGLMKSSAIIVGKQKKQQKKQAASISGILTVQDDHGVTYHIGRTNLANGELVAQMAKPNDWWFHVHQMPGSHILVKLPTDKPAIKDLPNQVILQAANLAVYFSSARDGKNVPVIYTQMKHVRKIPGSYPGHVTYKQEQSVFITVDSEILNTLAPPIR